MLVKTTSLSSVIRLNKWKHYVAKVIARLIIIKMMSNYAKSLTKLSVVISHRKNRTVYHSLIQGLQYHDYYQSFADFRSYVEAQKAVDKKYQDRDAWIASTIQNMVNMGFFSSDRTILEYAKNIWKLNR